MNKKVRYTLPDSVVKVFVHNSALTYKPSAQRLLRAGEYVLAQVELDEKGPKAVILKNLIKSTLDSTSQNQQQQQIV